jgi:hypothetical protein
LVERRLHALQSKADDHLFDDVVESYFAGHKLKPIDTGQKLGRRLSAIDITSKTGLRS